MMLLLIRLLLVGLVVIGSCVPAVASTILVTADLQGLNYPGQLAQSGWQLAEVAAAGSAGTQLLPLAGSGSAAGVTATLVTAGSWYGRGGPDPSRGYVVGTSFDGVVSDLWFTRDLTFSLQLTGLITGSSYTVRAWHNDSYTINEGSAAGGGTVHPTLSGGNVSAWSDGTVTNRYGTQTDSAFGITSISFQPSSTTAVVTFARSGGSFTGVPLSGVEVTTVAPVPEPSACIMALVGLACGGAVMVRRRHAR